MTKIGQRILVVGLVVPLVKPTGPKLANKSWSVFLLFLKGSKCVVSAVIEVGCFEDVVLGEDVLN